MNAKLKKLGFTPAKDIEFHARIIMSVCGLEKQGKTHFAFTAPGPIAIFSTDVGEEGVIEKFRDEKEMHVMEIARIEEDSAEEAPPEWNKFRTAYYTLLKSDDVRTVIVDTATELWELIRLARFGRLTQVKPYHYGPVNAEFRTLIRDAYSYDKNVILIHKMKTKYVKDKRTDEYERSGFSEMGFLVQVNTQAYRDDPEDGGEFNLWIKDCRQNKEMAGEVLEGDMCTFPMMAMMVLPDADPGSWE